MPRRRKSAYHKNLFGALCMVAGVLLLMWGRNLAYTFTGKAQYLLTGSPGEKPVTLFAIGAGLALIGMYQVFWIRR